MGAKNILREVLENLDAVIKQKNTLGKSLWRDFLTVHPADLARFFEDIDQKSFKKLFLSLPKDKRLEVFEEFDEAMREYSLTLLSEAEKVEALKVLHADELTDFFDILSDKDLKKYLNLLHKQTREKVLSLLKFDPESAGGIMEIDVLSLMQDFTVEKTIKLIQRLKPNLEVHRTIYVTDQAERLVGYINLEDLVLQSPKARLESFMEKPELVAHPDEDQERIAKKMVHYGLMTVPVVDKNSYFLGVIPSETLVEVLIEEASEDVQKMAALAPMKRAYFDMSFFRMVYERGYILIVLLIAESFSGAIMHAYEATLGFVLMSFIPMLISTGGNTSSQTSAVAIQGMASGEIRRSNLWRFLRREFCIAVLLAGVLGVTAFGRVFYTTGELTQSFAVSLSLGLIVTLSVMLGSCIPIVLKRLNIDPAFAAGPFLATIVDIVGILIYCYMIKLILY